MVGSGDRSERIRTYNFPQGRVTDHRINLTLHRLPEILEGEMGELIGALIAEDEAQRLAGLGEYFGEQGARNPLDMNGIRRGGRKNGIARRSCRARRGIGNTEIGST